MGQPPPSHSYSSSSDSASDSSPNSSSSESPPSPSGPMTALMSAIISSAVFAPPCRPAATLPKERGPVETVPGRKAETDRVREGISEGFHPAQSGRVAPRGREPMAGREGRTPPGSGG